MTGGQWLALGIGIGVLVGLALRWWIYRGGD